VVFIYNDVKKERGEIEMNFIQKRMNKKGFTLVELIIVIAVMAILAAIVVPRMGGITQTFRANADERMCDQYARELEVRIQAGETIAASGTVASEMAAGETVETPASLAASAYYFLYNDAADTVTVFVALTADAPHAAVPANAVNAQRDGAAPIN
jgi:type IV pilus assembly protein PilA